LADQWGARSLDRKKFADCWADALQKEEGNKKTEALSGGEAARLLFCKLMLQKPNISFSMSRPTTLTWNRSTRSNIALQRYPGTVLIVTHDHDLIDEVATRIWHFENDHKITDFKGVYAEYQAVQV